MYYLTSVSTIPLGGQMNAKGSDAMVKKLLSIVLLVTMILTHLVDRLDVVHGEMHKNAVRNSENHDHLTFPSFTLPWSESENGNIKWSGGPHSWSMGGNLAAEISASHGSGLDFAKNGSTFDVEPMAAGRVIVNQCGFAGFGCIVAIRHNIGGTVMIYAHLKQKQNGNTPDNDLIIGGEYGTNKLIGKAGQSGQSGLGANIHLHVELRDGASNCDRGTYGADCGDIHFLGNPVGWDGRLLVDGYKIS